MRLGLAFLALVLAVMAATLSIPAVRAAIIDFLQIGAIRINLGEPLPTAEPDPQGAITGLSPAKTPIPSPTPFDLVSLLEIKGETTLVEAQRSAGFALRLPSYPKNLGHPDHIYLQTLGGAMVILVWMDQETPEKIHLALFEIGPGSWAGEKGAPYFFETTQVGDVDAVWAEGPYPLVLKNGEIEFRRIVAGNALIWAEDGVTYRLESQLTLDETRKIAESMQP